MSYIRNQDQLRPSLKHDGVDHINLSATGETELGRLLFVEWKRRFSVPGMGSFASARAFANWMTSGGDEQHRDGGPNARYFRTSATAATVNMLMLFGKYYQMCSMRSVLLQNQDYFRLPWVGYRKHLTGVREYDRWGGYGTEVKRLAEAVIAQGSSYDWAENDWEILNTVNRYLEQIAGDEYVPFEKLGEKIEAQKRRQAEHEEGVQEQSEGEVSAQQPQVAEHQRHNRKKKHKGNQKFTPAKPAQTQDGVHPRGEIPCMVTLDESPFQSTPETANEDPAAAQQETGIQILDAQSEQETGLTAETPETVEQPASDSNLASESQ